MNDVREEVSYKILDAVHYTVEQLRKEPLEIEDTIRKLFRTCLLYLESITLQEKEEYFLYDTIFHRACLLFSSLRSTDVLEKMSEVLMNEPEMQETEETV